MFQPISGTCVYGSTDTDKTFSATVPHVNTESRVLVVDVPNFTNSVTVTVYYKSDGGKTMYQQASIPKNAVTPVPLNLPLIDDLSIQCVLSGAPGGSGGTINLYLYVGVHQFH